MDSSSFSQKRSGEVWGWNTQGFERYIKAFGVLIKIMKAIV